MDVVFVVGKFDVVPFGVVERLAHGLVGRCQEAKNDLEQAQEFTDIT